MFIVQIHSQQPIKCYGPFTCPMEANNFGLKKAAESFGYYEVLPLEEPEPCAS